MARSMRGRDINMDSLFQSNQNTVAITGGGAATNARGDLLGAGGKILKTVEKINEEFSNIPAKPTQKVSLADTNKIKTLTGANPNAKEMREMMMNQQREKQQAALIAKKILLNTESMANGNQPIIKEYTDLESDTVEEEIQTPK